jgi:hypothetical protein
MRPTYKQAVTAPGEESVCVFGGGG